MPTYEHICTACQHEFELEYKMTDPVPTKCPSCNVDGNVKRQISGCSGKVELYGHELTQHLRAEGKKLAKEARRNEYLFANIAGETKYHQTELARNKR